MTNDWELHQVTLSRTSGFGLGMAVAGGVDSPYIAGDSAVIVSDVLRDGPAEGKLCVGDRLLSVNGISLLDVTHSFAIKQLKLAGNTVDLVVHRRVGWPPTSNQIMSNNSNNNIVNGPQSSMDMNNSVNPLMQPEVVLARRGTWEDLGMNLGYHLFISSLAEGSLAQREGLHVGDLITAINGIKTDHISLIDAVSLLSRRDEVRLTVQRPSDVARRFQDRSKPGDPSLPQQVSSGQLSLQSGSQPMASSSRVDLIKPRSWDQLNTVPGPQQQIVQPPLPPHRTVSNQGGPVGRRVAFQREPLRGTGLRIVGGNASGIFVASVERGSPAEGAGLREGDRILKVGNLDTQTLTKEEAALELIGQEGVVEMAVAPAPNEYSRLLSSGESGDSLFIRVHFDYRGGAGSGGGGGGGSTSSSTSSMAQAGHEAGFRRGEIFHVLDTLHGGVVGSWRALRVHPPSPAGATEIIIPNENRAQQLALTGGRSGPSRSHQASSIMRRKRSKSATPSGGARSSADPPSISSASSTSLTAWERAFFGSEGPSPEPFPPYERVVHRHPGFIRPVALFGPLADVARERLLRELPDKFASVTPPAMNGDMKEGARTGVIKLSSIRAALDTGRHALLDITPGAVQRLNFAQMAPIVLYLRPEGKSANKELRSQYARYSGRHGKRLLEESTSMENLAAHLFTGVVPITAAATSNNHTSGLNDWFSRVVEMIDHQQREPTWVTSEPTEITSPRLSTRRLFRPEEDAELTLRRHRVPWSTEAEMARMSAPNLVDRMPDGGAELEPAIRAVEGTLTRSISDPHMLSPPKANRHDDWHIPDDRMQPYTVGRSRGRALAPNGSGLLDPRLNRSMGLENYIYMAPQNEPGMAARRQYTSSSALFNDLTGEKSGSRGMGLNSAEVDPYAVHTLPGRRGMNAGLAGGGGDGYATVKPRSVIQQQQQQQQQQLQQQLQQQQQQQQQSAMGGSHDVYRYVRSSAMSSGNPNRTDYGLQGPKIPPPVAPKPVTQRPVVPQLSGENYVPASQSYTYSGPSRVQSGPPVSQYHQQQQQQQQQSPSSVFNSSAHLRLQARPQIPPTTEPSATSRPVFGHRLEPVLNTSSSGSDAQRAEAPITSEAMQRRRGGPDDLQIVAEKSGFFDDRGGILESLEHGVSLRIPPGALSPGSAKKEVYFKIYRENGLQLPQMLSSSKSGEPPTNGVGPSNGSANGSGHSCSSASGATLVSPLVMCGPHGLRFNRPVELRMPHRPDLRPDAWQFSLLHSSSETGHPGDWKETRVGSKGNSFPSGTTPRVLDNGQISVMVDHF